jgi:hypothetical protein
MVACAMTLALMLAGLLAQATPVPAPTGPCNHDASVLSPAEPDLQGLRFESVMTAEIKVTVEPDASFKAEIFKSSGSRPFDLAVLRAARSSTYAPKIVNCKTVEGTYLFRIDFQPQ